MPTPDFSRHRAYLEALVAKDWGMPSGFAGRTCFQAIPALALGRTDWRADWIEYSLTLLDTRRDCQDFSMAGLLHMLFRHSEALGEAMRARIEGALLNAKYAPEDDGKDGCCWHTENHQILYASAEYLAGRHFPDRTFGVTGQTGARHAVRGRARLLRWIGWRLRFSFSEWNSACYYDEDAAALVNLVAHADDAEVRQRAGEALSLLLFQVAANTWRGLPAGSQGRAYLPDQVAPDTTAVATIASLLWGEEPPPARLSLAAVLLADGDWEVPTSILAAGRAQPEAVECRERHSLDAEEGAAYGVDPAEDANLDFFQSAAQSHHPLVSETRWRVFQGRNKHGNDYADLEYYRACRARGEEPDAGGIPHALSQSNTVLFKTPEFAVGSAVAYRPGCPGYQQFVWSANCGGRAILFTTNPCPAEIPFGRPGPWVGNGILPKVVQVRNVLIALYRVRPYPIYDQPPWWREDRTHAYVPGCFFDESLERGGWWFGRKGAAFAALRPVADAPGEWREADETLRKTAGVAGRCEWTVPATDCAWICELGSPRTHGSFGEFVEALAAAAVTGGIDALRYVSPSVGELRVGWKSPMLRNGDPVETGNFPRFDNPWCQMDFGGEWNSRKLS